MYRYWIMLDILLHYSCYLSLSMYSWDVKPHRYTSLAAILSAVQIWYSQWGHITALLILLFHVSSIICYFGMKFHIFHISFSGFIVGGKFESYVKFRNTFKHPSVCKNEHFFNIWILSFENWKYIFSFDFAVSTLNLNRNKT